MANDIFLKIQDIEGESQDSKHAAEIDVLSWSWGLHQPASNQIGMGGGLGQVEVHDIRVSKNVDKSTPNLMKYCASGQHIKEIQLTSRKAGGPDRVEFIVITLKEAMISSISLGHASGNDAPTEEITINFGECTFDYQPQTTESGSGSGVVSFGYDVRQRVLS